MGSHILESHSPEGGEPCYLVLVEGPGPRGPYWLVADVALDGALSDIDDFLRDIWLECCDHLSAFTPIMGSAANGRRGRAPPHYDMSMNIGDLAVGGMTAYDYDFGSTTRLILTVLAESARTRQPSAVRLLAMNNWQQYACVGCGEEAAYICNGCGGMWEGRYFCEGCVGDHVCTHKFVLPITNSPRCGVCGYCGSLPRPMS